MADSARNLTMVIKVPPTDATTESDSLIPEGPYGGLHFEVLDGKDANARLQILLSTLDQRDEHLVSCVRFHKDSLPAILVITKDNTA